MGGDYFRLNTVQKQSGIFDPTTGFGFGFSLIDLFNPAHPSGPFSGSFKSGYVSSDQIDQYGLYAQDQIKLPYNFHVMGGIRYQYLHQQTSTTDPLFGGGNTATALSQDAVTPRVGIVWQPQNWLSLSS
ncbi:MAG: TonB-dependent receptor [Methylococcaceae bacterium]|nr:TonB-dependent receptor [Methylococcaceae bacterium]